MALNDRFDLRISGALKEQFIQHCNSMSRTPQGTLRLFIKAFIEGRLSVAPTEAERKINDLFETKGDTDE